MRTALASPRTGQTRQRERGQVLPIFAFVILIIVLLMSLIIDGTFAFQDYRNLDTIAYHAARAGANETANCTNQPGTNCPLNAATARARAAQWATDWASQTGLTLALNQPTVSGDTITVRLRVCYRFKVVPIGALISSPNCPDGTWTLESTQEARSLVGP